MLLLVVVATAPSPPPHVYKSFHPLISLQGEAYRMPHADAHQRYPIHATDQSFIMYIYMVPHLPSRYHQSSQTHLYFAPLAGKRTHEKFVACKREVPLICWCKLRVQVEHQDTWRKLAWTLRRTPRNCRLPPNYLTQNSHQTP